MITFPTSSQTVARHQALTHLIRDKIHQAPFTRIPFDEFMTLALFEPRFGYYMQEKPIGIHGAFTTAPEISHLFGQCLATYCKKMIMHFSEGLPVIVEIGAGTGKMAVNLLLALEKKKALPKQYLIIEKSSHLIAQQKANFMQWIPHLMSRITYQKTLCNEIEGIVIANEVLDVLPIHLLQWHKKQLKEKYVVWKENQFDWQLGEISTQNLQREGQRLSNQYLQQVSSYLLEINTSLYSFIRLLSQKLKKGCCLLIDYGDSESIYYDLKRVKGTLRCYYQHRCYANPLQRVGLQDITHDVNFTQLAEIAFACDFEVNLFATQAAFLLEADLLRLNESCYTQSFNFEIKGQLHQLLSPSEMGDRCKVMVLSRKMDHQLFSSHYDRRFCL